MSRKRAVVVHRRRVVGGHRRRSARGCPRSSRRSTARHGVSAGYDHALGVERRVELRHRPPCRRRRAPTSVGTLVDSCSAEMSSWMTRTSGLKRGGRPKCMIQFSRAPSSRIEVGVLAARASGPAPTDSGWSSGITPLPIGEFEERQLGALDERAHLVLGARPRHALADDHERPLGGAQRGERGARRPRRTAWLRGGGGHRRRHAARRPRRPRPRMTSSGRSR